MDGEGSADLVRIIERRAAEAAFGKPLVQNNFRAVVAEAIVDIALPDGWTWCSAEWAAWDFEHQDGTRLEVKQSAAKQTWAAPPKPSPPRFDIRPRTGRYEGATWIPEPGRYADIYVFAHHPVSDETADQRDPGQWCFHVVAANELPQGQSISLARLRGMTRALRFGEIGTAIEQLRTQLGSPPAWG